MRTKSKPARCFVVRRVLPKTAHSCIPRARAIALGQGRAVLACLVLQARAAAGERRGRKVDVSRCLSLSLSFVFERPNKLQALSTNAVQDQAVNDRLQGRIGVNPRAPKVWGLVSRLLLQHFTSERPNLHTVRIRPAARLALLCLHRRRISRVRNIKCIYVTTAPTRTPTHTRRQQRSL